MPTGTAICRVVTPRLKYQSTSSHHRVLGRAGSHFRPSPPGTRPDPPRGMVSQERVASTIATLPGRLASGRSAPERAGVVFSWRALPRPAFPCVRLCDKMLLSFTVRFFTSGD